MAMKLGIVAALVALLVTGCGRAPSGEPVVPQAQPSTDTDQLFEASTTVLESDEHPPMLCLGGIEQSLPPQCGDVPIDNWSWDDVTGEESRAGTTWGEFHVEGTFDGASFTVTKAGPPERDPIEMGEGDPIDTPCDEPDGGWKASDPSLSTEDDMYRAIDAARTAPDFAGVWIDYIEETYTEIDTTEGNVILNAAFTGNLDSHRSELEELWGGPLCLVEHDRALNDLTKLRNRVFDEAQSEFGLQILTSDVSEVTGLITIGVVWIDDQTKQAFEERYGPGTIEFEPALLPVK
jgi:hypothetical protein